MSEITYAQAINDAISEEDVYKRQMVYALWFL